jgi:hypothetical protein
VVINRGYKSWQKFYSLPKRYNRIRCFTFISGKHSWGDAGHKSRLYPSRGLFVMHMSQDISCISCGGVFLISCEKFALSFKIIVVIIKENIWNFLLSFSIISLVVCKGQLVRMNINFKKLQLLSESGFIYIITGQRIVVSASCCFSRPKMLVFG